MIFAKFSHKLHENEKIFVPWPLTSATNTDKSESTRFESATNPAIYFVPFLALHNTLSISINFEDRLLTMKYGIGFLGVSRTNRPVRMDMYS